MVVIEVFGILNPICARNAFFFFVRLQGEENHGQERLYSIWWWPGLHHISYLLYPALLECDAIRPLMRSAAHARGAYAALFCIHYNFLFFLIIVLAVHTLLCYKITTKVVSTLGKSAAFAVLERQKLGNFNKPISNDEIEGRRWVFLLQRQVLVRMLRQWIGRRHVFIYLCLSELLLTIRD